MRDGAAAPHAPPPRHRRLGLPLGSEDKDGAGGLIPEEGSGVCHGRAQMVLLKAQGVYSPGELEARKK